MTSNSDMTLFKSSYLGGEQEDPIIAARIACNLRNSISWSLLQAFRTTSSSKLSGSTFTPSKYFSLSRSQLTGDSISFFRWPYLIHPRPEEIDPEPHYRKDYIFGESSP